MKISPFAIVALAVLAACGGNQPLLSPESANANAKPPIAPPRHQQSWMDAGAANHDLLYVSDENGLVNVYRYWQHTLVGVLTNFQQPMGECVDKAGDVYITDNAADAIDEYAHGGTKPIYVISDSYGPRACAVDPKTGNLAVANFGDSGNVTIYAHARGKPAVYGDDYYTAVGYDKYGDLLAADLYNTYSGYTGGFDYLPVHSKSFAGITLSPRSSFKWGQVEAIAWDGKYWVIDCNDLYRFSINIKAEFVDEIYLLTGFTEGGLGPIWIYQKNLKTYGTQVVGTGGADSGESVADYWNYPAGGSPTYQMTKDLDRPFGIAVSLKQ
jgi:DNA-binding beta-propeller fold protein YncE/predicted small lipoprotein YifL